MDAQQILELFLKSGQELVDKGKTIAEDRLNLPEDQEQRRAMLSGAGTGAIAASALALLLGTGAGRKLTGASLKLGSIAAIGGVAYKAFQNWQSQQSGLETNVKPVLNEPLAQSTESRSAQLLKAMIAAAKADGHIDQQERNIISEKVAKLGLGDSATDLIMEELSKPLDIQEIAAGVESPEGAAEIYLISRVVLDLNSDQERSYLDQLAKALGLAPELVAQLESQVSAD